METIEISTSYYAKEKELRKNGYLVVGISIGTPKFCNLDLQLRNLAPTRYMLSEKCSMDEYLELYDKIIKEQTGEGIVKQLTEIALDRGYSKVALCCYEAPGKFCHRHILSNYLRECGYDVYEYKTTKEIQEETKKKARALF